SVTFFSDEELEKIVIDPAELRNPGYVKAKAVLEDIELFDAAFFGFSPREAAITDPQQRLFMECAWEALEHAGYNPEKFPGAIGVYAGAGANNYLLFNLASSGHLVGSINAFQALIHNKNDHLATRVAYKLNLRGPAVNVQTACSTSLVALHHACHSLLTYQSDICMAGGVTISHPQNMGYLYHDRGIGSPDGHCRTFDADAQGTVGGSGAGILVLKRYEEAVAEGDTIHAVILSSAINNDGSMKVGYTAPSVDGQAEVIETALGLAGIDPATIGYVEAHGTATPMGDPIEVAALTRAYRASTQAQGFCAIGSVKTNVGHLDTAAGVAGVIKTVEALKHAVIPASLHFQHPNPAIDFASSPFYVNAQRSEWRIDSDTPRRAGVSSFGLGGTNAHAILQAAPARTPSGPSRSSQLLILSAQTDAALEQANENLVAALTQQPDINLADVAYTLQVGRKAHTHRRMVVCTTIAESISHLEALTPERVFSRVQEPCNRPLTFMFPGQGSQYVQMGRELYEQEARFREEMDRCLALLKPHMGGLDLRAILFPPVGEEEAASKTLLQTNVTQPALFVIEYALAQLWLSWGVLPTAMIGHSVGEYVAACLAGVLSLEDALALVALRGQLIQSLPAGAMLSVPLAEKELLPLLTEELSLAAVNGPALCVVSGPPEAVAQLETRLSTQKVICRPLHTSHAFHSHMMEPILAQFTEAVRRVKLHAPQMPYLSNVTGTWITEAQATDPAYWARHIRQTVRFADGLAELLQHPDAVLLEVGPGRVLRTIVRWHPHKKPNQFMLASLPHPQEKQSDIAFLLATIGHLWLAGIELDGAKFYEQEQRHRLPLPTYPFQRQRYWIDLRPTHVAEGAAFHEGMLEKKGDVADWFYVPVWQESAQGISTNGKHSEDGPWLLFVTPDGPGSRFAAQLRAQGARVITVQPGSSFRKRGAEDFEINPDQRGEYESLLATLKEQELTPARIVHFWSVASEARSVEQELSFGFYALLYLAQALGTQRITTPVKLLVVSSNAQEVVGNDLLSPERATLVGPCMVIPREYPYVSCRSIDIAWPLPAGWQEERLLEQLAWESTSPATEPFVAYRSGRRWEKSFKPAHLDELPKPTAGLREQGTYLITGGLGGLGITFAEHLSQTVQANLVLVGRSDFPARELWDAWLTSHEAGDTTSRKIRQLREMEARGSQLLIAAADVTDEAAMRQVVTAARERFGAIHGVIHAAGVPAGGLVQLKSAQEVARVMGPKIQGTRVLERLFTDSSLDFLALCSSLTTAVGRLGQVDY
ncbi:MAG: SDR family NAD(P)-dependent oxidoreductase, partial [Ardenticatenales bacterium]|nr:SDR family NAD(P)-dependent oxidoreductase [Ardenticatenales bacterium]